MSEQILDELNASFVSQEKEFRGEKLAPYTEGSRLLLLQVRDDGDSSMYFVYAFIFIHILIKKDRQKAIELAWNKAKFREALMDFIAEEKKSDLSQASALVASIIEEATKGQVEVIGGEGGGNA
jgi:hypothetical protein